MKKILSLILAMAMCLALTACGGSASKDDSSAGGDTAKSYYVGVCQLMEHSALDQATKGFEDALKEAAAAAGASVEVDIVVAGGTDLCTTVVSTFVDKKADLIMGNATPALLAAANATNTIPVLGTSVTDYNDTFANNIPANVSGTSDAVPFDQQAKMMIETLNLVAGDKVGVLYCSDESNSKLQYEAVKALFESEGIVVEAYTFSETTQLESMTTKACSECKAIYVPSDNTVAENDTIVGNICNDYNIPVYTSYGGTICYASLAIDYYQLGWKTGEMAAEILLNGKSPADMEVTTLVPSVTYNEELCSALGIEVAE